MPLPQKILNPEPAVFLGTVKRDEDSIAALTKRMAKGDESAFREFYDSYALDLLRYLTSLHQGDLASAKDSLQETFLRIAKHVRCFEDENVFSLWIRRIARTVFIDSQRKTQRYRHALSKLDEVLTTTEDASIESTGERLREALANLESNSQRIVAAFYFEQLSQAEIAERERISIRAVEGRLARARAKLKEILSRGRPNAQ